MSKVCGSSVSGSRANKSEAARGKPPAGPAPPRKGLRSLAAKLSRLVGDGRHAAPPVAPPRAQSLPQPILSKFDIDEVEVLKKIYRELNQRSPEDGIDKQTFMQYFPLPGLWGQRLFMKFDHKKLGCVDYEDLMRGLSICCRGTKAERIKVLFDIFDLNGDGVLSREELTLLLSNVPNIETYIHEKVYVSSTTNLSRSNSKGTIQVSQNKRKGSTEEVDLTADIFWDAARANADRRNSVSSNSSPADPTDWIHGDNERFCSTSWRSSVSETPNPQDVVTKDPSQPQNEDDQSQLNDDSERPLGEDDQYMIGAGPSPMVAELLARVNVDQETQLNQIEGIVSSIIENYDAASSDALTLEDFKSFVEHHPRFLRLFSDCLKEEVWGLQGHVLYRPQKQTHLSRPGSHTRSLALSGQGLQHSLPTSLIEGTQLEQSTEAQAVELLQLEKWIKIQQLFTGQAAPKQLSTIQPMLSGASGFVSKATSRETVLKESVAESAVESLQRGTKPTHWEMQQAGPVYPRHTRYAGSREVLDFLETSLGQYGSGDEEDVDALVPSSSKINETDRETLWQDKTETLSCPNCHAPLLVCPKCDSRFPTLKLSENDCLTVICKSCTGGVAQQYNSCWVCQWPFQNAIEMIEKHDVKMEGSLWKIGQHSRRWVCRHMVLVDKLLYYYLTPTDNIPKGFIFLEGCFVDPISTTTFVAEGTTDEGVPPTAAGIRKFGFCIIHAAGNFGRRELFAADEATRDRWVAALRATLSQQPIDQLYKMNEVIGHGKFSLVYSATERATKRDYAVKVINKTRMTQHEKELLRGEMSILRLLRHPHVIFLKSLVTTREVLHIVMELVPGGELFDVISAKGCLPEMTVNRLTSQLLKTLVYLHKAGIVHRDLKPENILLTSKDIDKADIKIADFGLSCLCGPGEKLFQPCGTLVYVAPEVLTLEGYNHQVDLWSLGVIVYLLLCGRLPFPIMRNSGVSVLTEREKFYTPKFDLPAWKSVSRSAQDFICKLLQIDPAKRITGTDALNHIWIKNPTAVMKDPGQKPPPLPVPVIDVPKATTPTSDNPPAQSPSAENANQKVQAKVSMLIRTGTDEEEIDALSAPPT